MRKPHFLSLSALILAATGAVGLAQIKEMTLAEMVDTMDGAVHGEIVNRHVFRVDHDIDGPELYFTTLTVQGTSLSDGTATTVDVTYHGGFINDEEGVYNSEAPAAEEVEIGNRVVVFYAWADDMGGEVAANALIASHGGLYRSLDGPTTTTVMGRGTGLRDREQHSRRRARQRHQAPPQALIRGEEST